MVSKASEDFPDPESPVKTTSLSRGIVRSMSFRLCSRAPRMTIAVCCCALPAGTGFFSATDPGPHAAGLWLAPHARLRRRRRRQRLSIVHRIPAQAHQPVAKLRRPLELQIAGRLFHLTFQVFDQALDL